MERRSDGVTLGGGHFGSVLSLDEVATCVVLLNCCEVCAATDFSETDARASHFNGVPRGDSTGDQALSP